MNGNSQQMDENKSLLTPGSWLLTPIFQLAISN